jgi:hypothetical protein
MTTTKATRTIEISGKTVKVTLERGTWEEEIRLDGTLCGTKTHLVDRTEIALYQDGKMLTHGAQINPMPKQHKYLAQAIKSGSVGIIGGDWFVKADTAAQIEAAIAELEAENPKTEEMIAMEAESAERKATAERNLARMEAEERERQQNPGWCKRCGDYTYGDCGHR